MATNPARRYNPDEIDLIERYRSANPELRAHIKSEITKQAEAVQNFPSYPADELVIDEHQEIPPEFKQLKYSNHTSDIKTADAWVVEPKPEINYFKHPGAVQGDINNLLNSKPFEPFNLAKSEEQERCRLKFAKETTFGVTPPDRMPLLNGRIYPPSSFSIGGKHRRQKCVIIPDVHAPFHNQKLTTLLSKAMHEYQPDVAVFSGDFLDLFTLASHNELSLGKLRKLTLTDEYKQGNDLMDEFQRGLGGQCQLHYLWGNHEDRYKRELDKGDNAKYGDELRSPTEALLLEERGFKVYENWKEDAVLLGDHLEIVHGFWCSINAAKKHLEEFRHSVMFGHTHRFQTYHRGNKAAFNIGFLGDMNNPAFAYSPKFARDKWVNGFATVEIDDDGLYYANPVSCYADKFFLNGVKYA